MKKTITLLSIVAMSLGSCNMDKKGIEVSGKIEDIHFVEEGNNLYANAVVKSDNEKDTIKHTLKINFGLNHSSFIDHDLYKRDLPVGAHVSYFVQKADTGYACVDYGSRDFDVDDHFLQ